MPVLSAPCEHSYPIGTRLADITGRMSLLTLRHPPPHTGDDRRVKRPRRRVSTTKLRAVGFAPPSRPRATEDAAGAVDRDRFLLSVLSGDPLGSVVRVGEEAIIVGRGEGADFILNDPGLSWTHARLFRSGDRIFVEDLGSTNGTFVGNRRVNAPTPLADGDRIRLGGHTVLKLALADEMEEQAAHRLYESTVRDALTSVHNRRYLEERIASEASFALRHGTSFAIFLVDIDHFKNVNDDCGHQMGDGVLRVVAAAIQRILRPEDELARFGGDEFVVLARSISLENAAILAERIRAHVAELKLPIEQMRSVTVSIGVAMVEGGAARFGPEELLSQADTAMYEAKQAGRNRVVFH